jgi:CRP-like cAMP-binding protein
MCRQLRYVQHRLFMFLCTSQGGRRAMSVREPYDTSQPNNAILKRLPKAELDRVMSVSEFVLTDPKQLLIEPGKPIKYCDFVENGLHSMLAIVEHYEVEVATVGREGMIGLPLVFGETTTSGKVIGEVEGNAWRLPSDEFAELLNSCPVLFLLCRRYAGFLFDQAAQNSSCNRIHSIEERCAKWLLLTLDRMDTDEFQLIQDVIAQMLGVRRQSVNLASSIMQNAGLIRYSRGRIVVLDRAGLEKVSCECYGVIRVALQRFLQ